MPVDINADLGEGAGFDHDILPWITSANIACGNQASQHDLAAVIEHAARLGVVIGAHPSYPGRSDFGRARKPDATEEQVLAWVLAELLQLSSTLTETLGPRSAGIRFVKPHGGLYHDACESAEVARGLVRAVETHFRNRQIYIVGRRASILEQLTTERGHIFVAEGFADRRYQPDGTLVPRSQPDALINDVPEAVEQVERLVSQSVATICVHGDTPGVVDFVRRVRLHFEGSGLEIKPFVQ